MTDRNCARCEWTDKTDRAHRLAAEHAAESGHPLCVVCTTSLDEHERQTCVMCVGRVRRYLAEVLDTYALLPDEAGHHAGARIPGGDALVMLGPGSTAVAQIRTLIHNRDVEAGLRSDRLWDESHLADELDADPASVLFELTRWQDDWADVLVIPCSSATDATTVIGWLSRHCGRAAESHEAFDEFARDVRQMVDRLHAVTRSGERSDRGARCTWCDVTLVRAFDEPDKCDCPPGTPKHYARKRDDGEWVGGCNQGGRVEQWACPACKKRYTEQEYRLALRKQGKFGWMPLHLAAEFAERTQKDVRNWIDRGHVGAYCGVRYVDAGDGAVPVRSGPLMVWWPDVLDRVAEREERVRAAEARRRAVA